MGSKNGRVFSKSFSDGTEKMFRKMFEKTIKKLVVKHPIVPAADSPDRSGHFGLFRFPSDMILTFPEAKKVLYNAKNVTVSLKWSTLLCS
jgi:hypothetical protein